MRRALDLLSSLVVLVGFSPLLLLVAVVIVLETRGSPIYAARRIGLNGNEFRMYKFRTMVSNASSLGPAITGGADPRITAVGRVLRKTKIDELPQFLNVLRGEMTLVGPRPESPEIVALYTEAQRRVLAAKPGVTGRSQLEAGEESESIPPDVNATEYYVTHLLERKIQTDLQYLRERTVRSDAVVVASTVGLVVRAVVRR